MKFFRIIMILIGAIGDADPAQCVTRLITVKPPFYASAGAKAIYGFFAAAIMVLLIMYFHHKYKMRTAREAEILEMEKQRYICVCPFSRP